MPRLIRVSFRILLIRLDFSRISPRAVESGSVYVLYSEEADVWLLSSEVSWSSLLGDW